MFQWISSCTASTVHNVTFTYSILNPMSLHSLHLTVCDYCQTTIVLHKLSAQVEASCGGEGKEQNYQSCLELRHRKWAGCHSTDHSLKLLLLLLDQQIKSVAVVLLLLKHNTAGRQQPREITLWLMQLKIYDSISVAEQHKPNALTRVCNISRVELRGRKKQDLKQKCYAAFRPNAQRIIALS